MVRKALTALSFAAAVAVTAGPALAGDGSVRVMQSLSDRVAEALANPNSVPGNPQFAVVGTSDRTTSSRPARERRVKVQRHTSGFAHEAWRDLPPRR